MGFDLYGVSNGVLLDRDSGVCNMSSCCISVIRLVLFIGGGGASVVNLANFAFIVRHDSSSIPYKVVVKRVFHLVFDVAEYRL